MVVNLDFSGRKIIKILYLFKYTGTPYRTVYGRTGARAEIKLLLLRNVAKL